MTVPASNRSVKTHRRETGITLIEIMIAQLLGLLVISGALMIFGPSISLFEQSNAAALVQETARIAMDTLTRDIQQAGYRGCSKPQHQTSVVNVDHRAISAKLKNWAYRPFTVEGLNADATQKIDTLLGDGWNSRRFHKDSLWFGDILLVQSVGSPELQVVDHKSTQHRVSVDGDQRQVINKGNVVGISDCHQSTILQIDRLNEPQYDSKLDTTTFYYGSNVSANCGSDDDVARSAQHVRLGGNTGSSCNGRVADHAEYQFSDFTRVYLLSNSLYYLGVQPQTSYPSLYRMSMASDGTQIYTEVIAEGIENLRLRFGFDSNGDGTPDFYRSAESIDSTLPGWSNVVSIRLWLLATSLRERGHSRYTRSVWFPNTSGTLTECEPLAISTSDACPGVSRKNPYRRVFSKEIMLRNSRT